MYYMKTAVIILSALFATMLAAAQQPPNPYLQTTREGRLELTSAGASHFANLALACLQQEYPNKMDRTLQGDSTLKAPREMYPAFYGCFDWHSSVHGHWMLVRLLKQFPELPEAAEIRQKLAENLTADNILVETARFKVAGKSWERMYGWAWLLKLAEELFTWDDPDGRQWYENLFPLTDAIIGRYTEFLPVQDYPVRTGVHPNTAFGLSFAWDYANTTNMRGFRTLIEQRALDYFKNDRNCPAGWEPSGEDFLSACLEEANLMRRVLPKDDFCIWFRQFLPRKQLKLLLDPAGVADRSDPKIVHLDGLNMSRAWCLYGIYPLLKNKRQRGLMLAAAKRHLEATIPNVASEHYEGTHWLASFAVYALSMESE
jgi:hypothetical protein